VLEERRATPWYLNPVLHLALNAALVTAAELLLKKGATIAPSAPVPRWMAATGIAALGSAWAVTGIFVYFLSFVNWLYVLRIVPLHVAYPVTNLSHALIPLCAWILLGERFGPWRAVGILLIVAGTWFIARPPAERREAP
jgi:drug/metabolite transporter (DMT)-like permease